MEGWCLMGAVNDELEKVTEKMVGQSVIVFPPCQVEKAKMFFDDHCNNRRRMSGEPLIRLHK
jgi:hypothetical protein